MLDPHSTKCTGNVTWMKDGKIIDGSSNIDKFTFNPKCLYIHNLTEEDSGMYQAVATFRSERFTVIDIYTKEIKNDEEEKLWFHTIILLSKNTSLSLVDKTELELLGMETKKYLFENSTFSNNLIDEPAAATSLWSSIVLEEKMLKFANYFPQGSLTQSTDKDGAERKTEMALSKKRVRDIEDPFHQPTSSVFDSVLYYCFIKKAAPKMVLEEFFRSFRYVREENEECICLSLDFTKKLIERLDTDILLHKTISDTSVHSIISEQLRVPEEVLKWDYDARERFVRKIGKDAVKIYRSRLMIVGCEGAGKTTLLKRLLNRDMVEFPKTESTVGLDIHESIFKISDKTNKMIALSADYHCEKEKTLSITDFAGQSAYYACHQVYLSRRALYILVIDLSRNPNDSVSSEQNICRETLFDNWTCRDYNKFWMESISTYCDTASLVILVGTHKDVINEHTEKKKDRFGSFLSQLPDVSQLQQHLHRKNYFELGKPGESRNEIERLEKCIVDLIQKQSTWGEIVPKLWEKFDQELQSLKSKRLITFSDLIKSSDCEIPSQKEDILDMLRFFHDCGKILFFNEKHLSELIILDVQWFVNVFKEIVTDENHRTRVQSKEWTAFNETGMLDYEHLLTIWKELGLDEMIKYKDQVLFYMQRLGLIAVGKGKLYVPSVNKHELSDKDYERIEQTNHTSILKFRFPNFLPHFFFYRLVVASLDEWKAQIDGKLPLLFKNAAFLKYKDNYHRIVLGVSSTQIHLQIYTCNSKPLHEDVILKIRCEIETRLKQLTQTFHKPVEYFPGFTCKSTNVTEERDDAVFIRESEAVDIYLADPSELFSSCPKHNRNNHNICWKQMLKYWRKQRYKQIKWNKEDIDVEKGESSVKFINSD
ncbi:uncharacterized protein LOC133198085 [Saccostrea echinata]|uniref:uncharacterized protein LOC133198085 n=1 Tax=Saccostrea echinata TaxID=191078 RepID=UPI002A7F0F8F|nr:uncharacterized protein LOC133198085 [Saccostrea echinata]